MLAKPHSPAPEVSTSLSSSQFHAEESRGCVIVSALELRRRCINYKRSERSLKSGTCNDSRLRPGFGYPRLLWISCAVKRGDVDSNVVSSVTMSDEVIVESEQGGVVGEADRDRESKQEAGEENWFSTCQKARLYLLLVPFLWGTYGPALRFIYSQPLAPSASIITLSRKGTCELYASANAFFWGAIDSILLERAYNLASCCSFQLAFAFDRSESYTFRISA